MCGALMLAASAVSAEVPRLLHYQGRLTEPDGTPLVGTHAVTFRLYDAAAAGAVLWEERHEVIFDVRDEGLFATNLGSVTPFPGALDFNQSLWLTTAVGDDGELLPRQQLTAVAYAVNADLLDGFQAASFLRVGQVSVSPPADVGAVAQSGIQPEVARTDHVHRGLHSVAASGQPPIFGDAVLAPGTNVTLTQDGQTITVETAGAGALSDEPPADVGETAEPGTAEAAARGDHAHQGLHSLAVDGQPALVGDALLAPGANVTLTQDGQTITVEAASVLSDEPPADVGETAEPGTAEAAARGDHAHQGLHSLAVDGQPALVGDALLAPGSNITLTQDGQTITIDGAGGGAPTGRASTSSTSAVGIGVASDTELLSVTITKTQDTTALLIIATVQLEHVSVPTDKEVDLKLFRGGSQLDASYTARIGQAGRTVSDLPATIHGWDTSAAGSHTFSLRARSDGAGAQATVRRLTVLEL